MIGLIQSLLRQLYDRALHALQASGNVTFRDAEAASEMRQYVNDSRAHLHVEVRTHYICRNIVRSFEMYALEPHRL